MIKKLIALCAVLALMISATGCVGVSFMNRTTGGIIGSGSISVRTFSCDKLNKLILRIPGELYFTKGEPEGRIELYSNLMEHVTFSENNGTLIIDSERSFAVDNDRDMPKIYVSAPSLEALTVDSVVYIKEMATITSDTFTLDIDGVFDGTIDLAVENLNVDIGGVGNVVLTGTADSAVIDMSGVVNLKAFDLKTRLMNIESSGIGNAEVSCSEKLIAELSGMGGIQYKGECNVQPDVSGMGKIKKAD